MFVGFTAMEASLREFLTEANNDHYSSRNTSMYKYNNLKIYMDPKKNPTPHIIIRLGISEVIYDLKNWEKISGGLGSDERYIKHWVERHREHLDLEVMWREAKADVKKIQPVVLDSQDTDFSQE